MKRISQEIVLLESPPFKYPYSHCLYIEDDIRVLVDSSPCEQGQAYLQGKQVDLIINSHGHLDHCFLNPDYPWAPVCLHENDHNMVAAGDAYLQEFGFEVIKSEVLRSGYLSVIGYRPRAADKKIQDGEKISLGKTSLEVLFLPGHCAGHCGFIFPREGFVFTADIDLGSFPWYGNTNSNLAQFLASIEKLQNLRPEMVITGHGAGLIRENIPGLLLKYRDIILRRELEIAQLLTRGKNTLWEIAAQKPIYKSFPQPEWVFFLYEYMMDLKHLEHLQEIDKVVFDGGSYYLKGGIKKYNLNLI